MLDSLANRILGDIAFPMEWTVFAPLKRDDPVMDRKRMTTIPAELRVGGQVVKPEGVIPTRGQVDFEPFFGPNPEGFHKTAYIFLKLDAAQAGAVSLGVGWDYLLDLWLNGEPLLDKPEAENPNQPISVTNHRLTLPLKAGENILVARLTGGGGPVILALAGPRELRAGDFRRILDDPARIDPGWCDVALKARPGGKDAVEIGDRRELFVDDFLVDGLSGGATRRLHHPVPREVVLRFDRSWEAPVKRYVSVVEHEGRIRLYYAGRPNVACMAESADGIHFERPELGLFEFDGSKRNNIVWGRGKTGHNFTPFKDPNPAAPPDQRFKAVGDHPQAGGEGQSMAAFASPDGIHWRLLAEAPIITEGAFDSQNLAFWDPLRGVYVDYHRGFRGARPGSRMLGYRDIMTCVSEDFIHWSEPRFLDYNDARRFHLYTNGIRPYARAPHLYIGMPMRFMNIRKKIDTHPHAGLGDAMLMSSRDGHVFERWAEAFIAPGLEPYVWTDRMCEPAWGMWQSAPEELCMYWVERDAACTRVLRRGTLRVDGFASMHAGGEGVGEMLTRPLVFSGRRLEINYATSAAGTMLFALCDEFGEAFEGFSLDDSEMLYGNELAHTVTWRGVVSDLRQFAGRKVRLRVRLQDADLYAIRFLP